MAGITTAGEYVESLRTAQWARYRFGFDQKEAVLAFLRKHYESWRDFDPEKAEKVMALTFEEARRHRGLDGIVELGRAWWATGDEKYGRAFERFYRDTPTSSMYLRGDFNGSQGVLELTPWFMLLDCPGFSTEGRIGFLDHLFGIADFAWDEATSRWSYAGLGMEGHNWYLHGMHMLPFMGLLFPELKRAAFFLKTGWSVVEEHVRGHFKSDGGARETTLGYQSGSMLCLWDFYALAKYNGHPVSDSFADRLLNASRFLLDLGTPAGSVPSYGDSHHEPGQLVALAATAAAMTGDGVCKWYAEHWRGHRKDVREETAGVAPESAFMYVGFAGAETYERTKAVSPNMVSVLKPDTGYLAMRSDDSATASYMAMAAAERGPIVTSHGHNDIFSLEVHAGGIRFVGEMGCAPYGDSLGRFYDQTTAAHTCFTIKGREQVPIVDEWRWEHQLRPSITRWISEPTHDFFQGVHEGFYRYPVHKTMYSRKVFFRKPDDQMPHGYWIVMDWVESFESEKACATNDYQAYFHGCVPGRVEGQDIVLGKPGRMGLVIRPPANDGLVPSVVSDPGLDAYIEEKKLDAQRYPCFVYETRAESACCVWAVLPCSDVSIIPSVQRVPVRLAGRPAEDHEATGVTVTIGDRVETLVVSHRHYDAELATDDWSFWGLLGFRAVAGSTDVLREHVNTVTDG